MEWYRPNQKVMPPDSVIEEEEEEGEPFCVHVYTSIIKRTAAPSSNPYHSVHVYMVRRPIYVYTLLNCVHVNTKTYFFE